MPYEEIDLGLNLTIPTNGTRNWGTTLKQTTWTKISQHTHTGDGDGAKLVSDSFTAGSVDTAALADNIALKQYNTVNVVSANSITIDLNNGMTQYLDLDAATGTVTIAVSNAIQGATYRLIIIQGTPAYGVIWPAAFEWQGGTAYGSIETPTDAGTISEGDNEKDVVIFYCGRNPPATANVFYANFELNIKA